MSAAVSVASFCLLTPLSLSSARKSDVSCEPRLPSSLWNKSWGHVWGINSRKSASAEKRDVVHESLLVETFNLGDDVDPIVGVGAEDAAIGKAAVVTRWMVLKNTRRTNVDPSGGCWLGPLATRTD
jgi:hypothetical protein